MPLLVSNANELTESVVTGKQNDFCEHPLGIDVIRVVRDYDGLTNGELCGVGLAPAEAIRELRSESSGSYNPLVITALERCVEQQAERAELAVAN